MENESGDEVSEMVNQAEGIGFVNRRLTVTSLKLIAILAMFIDHFAAIVLTSLQSVYGQSLESFLVSTRDYFSVSSSNCFSTCVFNCEWILSYLK
ncbi:MAG: hypothetical protein ACLRQX_08510 [Turicibacter sanguinis]